MLYTPVYVFQCHLRWQIIQEKTWMIFSEFGYRSTNLINVPFDDLGYKTSKSVIISNHNRFDCSDLNVLCLTMMSELSYLFCLPGVTLMYKKFDSWQTCGCDYGSALWTITSYGPHAPTRRHRRSESKMCLNCANLFVKMSPQRRL